jgi:UDP-3-O-[3-hydroxymyristoyl] glucosamine N-acyltransferase
MSFSLTLKEIANLTDSKLSGDKNKTITEIASLEKASYDSIAFFNNPRYTKNSFDQALENSKAGAIFLSEEAFTLLEKDSNFLITPNPSLAFQKLIDHVFNTKDLQSKFEGIHNSAVIHETASIGKSVTILPNTVIDAHVSIGENSFIGAGVYIGPHSVIGDNCLLHSGCIVREKCTLGNGVILQPNAVIGSCGFGYDTNAQGQHTKLSQLGSVTLEDNVEIGACSTIDRARFEETRICKGSKIDNLVQIAHGVTVGQCNLIAAQSGVAGSAKTGYCVIMGGQSGIIGHVEVESGVILAARGGISRPMKSPGTYGGVPARPIEDFRKQEVHLKRLDQYVQKIKDLEKRLEKLESSN